MGGFKEKQIVALKHLDDLIARIGPHIFQVKKDDVLSELPPKHFEIRYVDFTPEQRQKYKLIHDSKIAPTQEAWQKVASSDGIQNALEKILRLQQIAGGFSVRKEPNPDPTKVKKKPFVYFPEKIPGVNKKIEEIIDIAHESGGATVIWCAFTPEIEAVKQALADEFGPASVVEISGRVSENDRAENIERFQSGSARFLVGNAATGGMGIDLQTASIVIYYSNTYRLEDRLQSEDRAHRMGQKNSVLYIDLVVKGSVDELVSAALHEKKSISDYICGAISDLNLTERGGENG